MHVYGEISGTLTSPGLITGSLLASPGRIKGSLSVPSTSNVNVYDGPYEFTPTTAAQTAQIADKLAVEDIIINPIPSNYGLIAWDGSTLTVS